MHKLIPAILATLALTSGQALAHARLLRADPKDGSSVTSSPTRIALDFGRIPIRAGTGIQMTGPDGNAVELGAVSHDEKVIFAPVPAKLAPGRYAVHWTAASPDGHISKGDLSFTVLP